MKNQKGFAHIFLIIFILVGLAVAVYLVQQKTNILPKAYEESGIIPPLKPSPIVGIPDQPTNVAGSCVDTFVSIHWNAVQDDSIDYYVRYRNSDGTWWPSTDTPLNGKILGALGKMRYEFKTEQENQEFAIWGVIACNNLGCSDLAKGSSFSCSSDLSRAKRIFVTSTIYDGNLGGLEGGDAKCQVQADTAGLGGIWKAWLSDDNISASERLSHHDGPYIRLDNVVIANDWADLTDGTIQNPIDTTEKNSAFPIELAEYVWTGTTANGEKAIYRCTKNKETCRKLNTNCLGWQSLSYISSDWIQGSTGYTFRSTEQWSGGLDRVPLMICNTKLHLYCFEQ